MAHASIKRSARYQTLKRAYASAKRDRRTAGLRFKKAHTGTNRAAYNRAELEWQATGSALGMLTGTHQRRKQRAALKIHSAKYRAKRYLSKVRKSR